MKQYFSFLKDELKRSIKSNQYANLMLIELRKMINKNQQQEENPINFFDFYEQNSNVQLPTFRNSLISKKFSFFTWIRFEDFQNIFSPLKENIENENIEKIYKTQILSFLTDDSKGIELLLEFNKETKQPESFLYKIYLSQENELIETKFPFEIETKKWTFFVFTQKYKRLNSELEVCIYLGEKQQSSKIIKLTKKIGNTKQPFIQNEIGSNFTFSNQENQKSFFGQIGTIYFFQEFLNENQVKAIHFLGPNYKSFFYQNEIFEYSNPKFEKELKENFNGKLSQKTIIYHNPKETKNNFCLNQSPSNIVKGNSKINKIYSFTKTNFQDIIHCLGGIRSFFYLILQIDELFDVKKMEMNKLQLLSNENVNENVNENSSDTKQEISTTNVNEINPKSLFEEILKIIRDILLNDPNFQEEMIQKQLFPIFSNLLKSINPKYFSSQIYDFIKKLKENIENEQFQIQLKNNLIFDFNIWKHFIFEIQQQNINKESEENNENNENDENNKNDENIKNNENNENNENNKNIKNNENNENIKNNEK
ncbi:beach domain-containing protein lvsc [Anaeramoeba ignava]|uniref:Beach domain-containing protein lvsc n=1 Tax=Anaeramoeba ignava TaxID=1746090 RepID=A0A9Q0R807_ANAIG|nr:beach domain-containing protein lvsc [Anaeramoeba ignava]